MSDAFAHTRKNSPRPSRLEWAEYGDVVQDCPKARRRGMGAHSEGSAAPTVSVRKSVITSNPFAELSALIAPIIMQSYVVLMIVFVAGGTLYDTIHKRSAEYFFDKWRR